METLLQDARYGIRILRKNPGFTFIAVLTLALGIGANTAIFSVVYGILFKPLPYPEPDRLVRVFDSSDRFPKFPMAPGNFLDYRARNSSFSDLAIYMRSDLQLAAEDRPERLEGMQVSSGFFRVLGINPALGREFLPEEEIEGRHRVVILSDRLWRERFGADPAIIGKTVKLSTEPYTVVGVLQKGVQHVGGDYRTLPHGETVDIWCPMVLGPEAQPRNQHYTNAVGRLKPGVTPEQATSDLRSLLAEMAKQYPATRNWSVRAVSLRDEIIGKVQPMLLLLLGAAGIVMLIACVNVANLLLARGSARESELALRAALGARRSRLVRQLLTESLLLAILGSLLGLVLAFLSVNVLVALSPQSLPRTHMVALDGATLLFMLTVALLTAVLFGLAPAFQISWERLHDALKSGTRDTARHAQKRLRGALVVGEVALAFVLLIGAGLLARSFLQLARTDPGFNPHNVLTASVSVNPRYTPQTVLQFHRELIERVRKLPGVEAAGLGTDLPWTGYDENSSFGIPGRVEESSNSPTARYHMVSDDYFRAIGTPLIGGRFFTDADTMESPRVLLINEAMSQRYWRDYDGSDPVGRKIQLWGEDRTIIGVVGNVKDTPTDLAAKPAFYFPVSQRPRGSLLLVVRTSIEPRSLLTTVEQELAALDPELPLADVATLEEVARKSTAERRFTLLLVGLFAVLALVLASVGIYGVIAYSVAQRTHEIGVRMALGARTVDILKMVIREGMVLALFGVVLGLVGAFAITRLMSSLLFGVSATDPATFGLIPLLLIAVALLACYVPARRATRVDPMVVLRYE
jgi:predicted permease